MQPQKTTEAKLRADAAELVNVAPTSVRARVDMNVDVSAIRGAQGLNASIAKVATKDITPDIKPITAPTRDTMSEGWPGNLPISWFNWSGTFA